MRIRDYSTRFKRDYKKVKATPRYSDIDSLLETVVPLLLADKPLPPKCKDMPSKGNGKAIVIATFTPIWF